ncbi:MAG: alpha-D-ribose 1-methylphosphonate 5-triphosphate diphosphatase [Beijerinckiaceae bacterium]
MYILIRDAEVLFDGVFARRDVMASPEGIRFADAEAAGPALSFDGAGLMLLPGAVDIHGDAFERQVMPRPGVGFPLDLAFLETDRQLVANGITTACHGVTCSWEPGIRSAESAGGIIAAIHALRPRLKADSQAHLRHETFHLDAEETVAGWIGKGLVRALAFNDHMAGIVKATTGKQAKVGRMAERAGLNLEQFHALVDRVFERQGEVASSVARLAGVARSHGVAMLSHDDRHVEDRRAYRALGCAIAEFPMTEETAREATEHGEFTVFGAPNVVRGGSHTGCPSASEMAAKGLCGILASDYYHPALTQAPAMLARDGIMPLADAWALVSRNPAKALGLDDRGEIAEGKRADLLLARQGDDGLEIAATIAGGRLAWLGDAGRLRAA